MAESTPNKEIGNLKAGEVGFEDSEEQMARTLGARGRSTGARGRGDRDQAGVVGGHGIQPHGDGDGDGARSEHAAGVGRGAGRGVDGRRNSFEAAGYEHPVGTQHVVGVGSGAGGQAGFEQDRSFLEVDRSGFEHVGDVRGAGRGGEFTAAGGGRGAAGRGAGLGRGNGAGRYQTPSRTRLFSDMAGSGSSSPEEDLEGEDACKDEHVQVADANRAPTAPATAKRTRGKNWKHEETMFLIDLVREDRLAKISGSKTSQQATMTPAQRWKLIAGKLNEAGFARDRKMCNRRWNNMLNDYKSVGDFQRRTGNPDYFSLSETDAHSALPGLNVKVMLRVWYDAMDDFLKDSASTAPTFLVDSEAILVDDSNDDPAEGDDPPGDSTKVPESSGKRKKRMKTEQSMSALLMEGNKLNAVRNNQNLVWQKENIACQRQICEAEKEKASATTALAGAIVNISTSLCNFLSSLPSSS